MQKAKLVADRLSQEFSAYQNKPRTTMTWSTCERMKGEKFSISYERGSIKVEGESFLAAAYGVSKASIGAKSGHIAEFLGEAHPHYPLRPLWVGGTSHLKLTDNWGVSLPSFFILQDLPAIERWCQRVIELGFNAILLGSREHLAASCFQSLSFNFHELISLFHEYGIQLWVKPSILDQELGFCPFNPAYRVKLQTDLKNLVTQYPEIDSIFWESLYLHPSFNRHPAAKDFTIAEIVLEEVRAIEEVLSCPIIYYIPVPNFMFAKQQAAWLSKFCDDVGSKTTVAFSAVAGNLCEDHLPPHPFWEYLRQSHHVSATRLLPIINMGSVLQGEGLWPAVPLDLLENYYSRLYRHCFAGAMSMVNALPKEGGLLDCSLWLAAQCLWEKTSPKLLAETWFQAYRPDWDFSFSWELLESTRQIIVELSFLRSLTNEMSRDSISSEECRTMTESILSRLNHLKMRAEKIERRNPKKIKHSSLMDYLSFFIRDAQRIILYFLQCFNLSYPNLFQDEDLQESFWTQLSKSGQGIRSGTKVTFFDEPQRGEPGSKMELILFENRFF